MAKLVKATIDLTGVSIGQIMNMDIDINKLSRGDLARVVGRLVSASNKRIRSLAKTELGRMSPAYQSRIDRGGMFSTIGKNTNQLRQLYGEAKGFLQLKTSSIRGWGRVRKDIEQSIGIQFDSVEDSKKFWEAYRRFAEGKTIPDKNTGSKYNSEVLQKFLAKTYSKKGFDVDMDSVLKKLDRKFEGKYEEEQREDETDETPEIVGEQDSRTINELLDDEDDDEDGGLEI